MRVSDDHLWGNGTLQVSIDVKNTGKVAGKEVVQMYLGNKVNSVTTPVMALKGFDKIALEPGEKKTVKFTVMPDDIAIWNTEMQRVTESGKFDIMIGRSAEDVVSKMTVDFN